MNEQILRVCVIALIAIGGVACGGGFVSGAGQPGSTVLIPIPAGGNLGIQQYGFGGSLVTDYQNGQMVIALSREMLGETETVELETLMSFLGEPPVESPLANRTNSFGRQLVIVAEIPASAAPGSYQAEILHRLDGVDVPVFDAGPFTILPDDYEVIRADGTPEVVSGTSSQLGLTQWTDDVTGVADLSSYLGASVPLGSFGVTVRGSAPDWPKATYAAVDLTYPVGVITILDAYAVDPGEAHVWFEDDGAGTVRLHSITFDHPELEAVVKPFRVTFSGSLDRDELSGWLVAARNATGEALTAPITIEITQ